MKYTYEDYKEKLNSVFLKYKQKCAVTCIKTHDERDTLTYGNVSDIVDKIGKLLSEVSLVRGDRIAVISKHTPEAVVLNLALAYLGYMAVLLDAGLPKEELNRLVTYADISAVFTTKEVYHSLDGGVKRDIPCFCMQNGFVYELFEDSVRTCTKEGVEPRCTDTIAIIFSSGTTAQMKGIMVTYHSILYAHKYMLQYTNLNSEATFLDVLPSNHIAGYSSAMSCFLTGTELGFISDMSAENLLSGFLNYKPTNFIMIPKVYEVMKNKIEDAIEKKPAPVKWYAKTAMKFCGSVREKTGVKLRFLTKPIWKAALGSNMKICGCGTLPCSEELMRFYLNLGIDFVNVYGATETGFPITAANCNDKYPIYGTGNVGQFEEVEIEIHEPDSEGIGEIRVKTPLIMKGYFKEPELTEQAFDESGYFKTGDLGYVDATGNLYVTGRIKESILLHSGKKVSPIDVDKYYQNAVPGMVIASCGIETAGGYDGIYLFVEKANHTENEVIHAVECLREASRNTAMYKAEQVVAVDKIPVTTVGKVKRYLLKDMIQIVSDETEGENVPERASDFALLADIVRKLAQENVGRYVDRTVPLKALGLDSLGFFQFCVEAEGVLGVTFSERIKLENSIDDVLDLLGKGEEKNDEVSETSNYPKKKGEKEHRYLKKFFRRSNRLWKLTVKGIENIPTESRLLFCPNHESYFDALWVAGALQENGYDTDSFCCLAAKHLKEKKLMKKAFYALGGIPVDRNGNTAPAIRRAEECLREEHCMMLIHPEGTRTRTGELGDFKCGAAKLAKETGTKVIPVCINGAYEIFPPSAKLPKVFNLRKLRRYPLELCFGPAIDPKGMTEEEINRKIREYIVEQKKR
ncbi:MAG: AMP-binding protein [Lachnospiraceae bacterium]|nr:AMP-binding protein [Lachnospiraceae bacterium]